jgi:hypothetical protein
MFFLRQPPKDPDGDTPLHVCEEVATAQVLVGSGADPQIRNLEGKRVSDTGGVVGGWGQFGVWGRASSWIGRSIVHSPLHRMCVLSFHHTHTHSHTYTQPHDAAEENGFLELTNYLRSLCGLAPLERVRTEEDEEAGDADIVIDLAGDDDPNGQDAQEGGDGNEGEAMAE